MSSKNNRLLRPILLHRETDSPIFGKPKSGKRFLVHRPKRRRGQKWVEVGK